MRSKTLALETATLGVTATVAHGGDAGFSSAPTPYAVILLDKMRNTPPPPPPFYSLFWGLYAP